MDITSVRRQQQFQRTQPDTNDFTERNMMITGVSSTLGQKHMITVDKDIEHIPLVSPPKTTRSSNQSSLNLKK